MLPKITQPLRVFLLSFPAGKNIGFVTQFPSVTARLPSLLAPTRTVSFNAQPKHTHASLSLSSDADCVNELRFE